MVIVFLPFLPNSLQLILPLQQGEALEEVRNRVLLTK
jgi:hypothetical protein